MPKLKLISLAAVVLLLLASTLPALALCPACTVDAHWSGGDASSNFFTFVHFREDGLDPFPCPPLGPGTLEQFQFVVMCSATFSCIDSTGHTLWSGKTVSPVFSTASYTVCSQNLAPTTADYNYGASIWRPNPPTDKLPPCVYPSRYQQTAQKNIAVFIGDLTSGKGTMAEH